MKKVLLLIITLLGGVFIFLGLLGFLPDEWREKFFQLPGLMMKRMMDSMPEE